MRNPVRDMARPAGLQRWSGVREGPSRAGVDEASKRRGGARLLNLVPRSGSGGYDKQGRCPILRSRTRSMLLLPMLIRPQRQQGSGG